MSRKDPRDPSHPRPHSSLCQLVQPTQASAWLKQCQWSDNCPTAKNERQTRLRKCCHLSALNSPSSAGSGSKRRVLGSDDERSKIHRYATDYTPFILVVGGRVPTPSRQVASRSYGCVCVIAYAESGVCVVCVFKAPRTRHPGPRCVCLRTRDAGERLRWHPAVGCGRESEAQPPAGGRWGCSRNGGASPPQAPKG